MPAIDATAYNKIFFVITMHGMTIIAEDDVNFEYSDEHVVSGGVEGGSGNVEEGFDEKTPVIDVHLMSRDIVVHNIYPLDGR